MVAYNFKAQFADAVESGKKRQTIRRRRKYPTMPGDWLQLYTGMRTRRCRKLADAKCIDIQPFRIDRNRLVSVGNIYSFNECETVCLAHADGFASAIEFVDFFERTYGLPFHGELIRWELIDHD